MNAHRLTMVSTTSASASSRPGAPRFWPVVGLLIGLQGACAAAQARSDEVPTTRESTAAAVGGQVASLAPVHHATRRAAAAAEREPTRRAPEPPLPVAVTAAVAAVPTLRPGRCGQRRHQDRLDDQCRAPQALVLGCRAGGGEGCTDLADCHRWRWRRPESAGQIKALYRAGCDRGSARGCLEVGRLLMRGRKVARDRAAALRHFERACRGGSAAGCAAAGTMRYVGVGTTRDVDGAAHLFDRACKDGAGAGCRRLGVLYARGEAAALIARLPGRALALYERGCELCDGASCRLAAQRLALDPNQAVLAQRHRAEELRLKQAKAAGWR